jgi:hypothetical protein
MEPPMTSTQNSTATTVCTSYVWVATDDVWGDTVTADEHAAACERAEAWLTAHEGDTLSISVRPPHRGEAGGTYLVTDSGLQILGYSVSEPEDVRELIERARMYAIETWRMREGHVHIVHETGAVDTYYLASELAEAQHAMRAAGILSLPVYRGAGPDEIKTSMRLFT